MKEPFFLITDMKKKVVHAAEHLIASSYKWQITICMKGLDVKGKKQNAVLSRGRLEDVTCKDCKRQLENMGWL